MTKIHGIHGTLIYELEYEKEFYPNRRDSDLGPRRARSGIGRERRKHV
jgi:hypothetical protein